jgi:mono/diheme cytochrome c family protein
MTMRVSIAIAALAGLAIAGPAQAADKKLVNYYKETCGVCHGEKGEGTPGLAPGFKGNKFITEGSEAEIANTITKGRMGGDKRYKDLASPMPPASMSDGRLKALIAYMKTDLQK